jgi:hypothetical protein
MLFVVLLVWRLPDLHISGLFGTMFSKAVADIFVAQLQANAMQT